MEDIYNMKSPLFVRHNSGHKAKKGHQRQSFNTVNFVPITKATCYALRLNHNKEEGGRSRPRSSQMDAECFGGTVNCFKHSEAVFLTSSLHAVMLRVGLLLQGLTAPETTSFFLLT